MSAYEYNPRRGSSQLEQRPSPGTEFRIDGYTARFRALGLDDAAKRAKAHTSEALEMKIDGRWYRISWASIEAANPGRVLRWVEIVP